MKRLALVVTVLWLALVGCSANKSVVGVWKVDPTSLADYSKLTPAAKQAIERGRITLNADKTMVSDDGSGLVTKGKWELKESVLTMESEGRPITATMGDDGRLNSRVGVAEVSFVRVP